jgi:hypothetical protein
MQEELKNTDIATLTDTITEKILRGDVAHINVCDICNIPITDDNLSEILFKLNFLNKRKRKFKVNICKECYNKLIQKFEDIYEENNSNTEVIIDNSNIIYTVDGRETNFNEITNGK